MNEIVSNILQAILRLIVHPVFEHAVIAGLITTIFGGIVVGLVLTIKVKKKINRTDEIFESVSDTKTEQLENIKHINSIKLDGNNNVVVQGADKSNITITITVPLDDFASRYTKDKEREINGLYERIDELNELREYDDVKIIELSNQIGALVSEKKTMEEQILNMIKEAEKTDFSLISELHQKAYLEFIRGNIKKALDLLSEDKLRSIEDSIQSRRKKEDYRLAMNRILRAQMLVLEFKFEEAEMNFKKAVCLNRSADNLSVYAFFLYNQHQYDKAYDLYEEALGGYKELAEDYPEIYLVEIAGCLVNLGNLNKSTRRYEKYVSALSQYKEAFDIFDSLNSKKQIYLDELAGVSNNLGELMTKMDKLDDATKYLTKSMMIYRIIYKLNPNKYVPVSIKPCINLGNLYRKKGEFDTAACWYQDALSMQLNNCNDSPGCLSEIALTMTNLANTKADLKDYDKAHMCYREALSLRKKLASRLPTMYLPGVAMTLVNFSIFHTYHVKDKTRAIAMAKECMEIAKSFPNVPDVQGYSKKALQILQANGVNTDEIMKTYNSTGE